MAMAVCRYDMKRITWCSMTRASPEATGHRHWATTRLVLPHWPPGWQSTQQWCNMYPLWWLFWWPSQCGSTIPHASPDGGGSWLSLKPLNATVRWALAPIASNRTPRCRLFWTFHCENELLLTCWSLITIVAWHVKLTRSTLLFFQNTFVGVVKLAINHYSNRFLFCVLTKNLLQCL